ncbi:hypothetical protein GCM10029992_51360 [Glycomyces albus]
MFDVEAIVTGGDSGVCLRLPEYCHGLRGGLVVGDDDGWSAVVGETGQDLIGAVGRIGVED